MLSNREPPRLHLINIKPCSTEIENYLIFSTLNWTIDSLVRYKGIIPLRYSFCSMLARVDIKPSISR